ncbi:histidine kinase [Terrimonas sp. NA20]|uniref:Histidine kinase n=1 Tax=Terrimonas ginsenosidimutans TaxID=2908004 RepID=A0ABS9KUI4_9BACT|nr:histidine kinase [Terrimonas ginsenosidimutans]MCG2615940.1 histidine kinase [Terrimonas ginsenosidimutans]
MSFNWRKKVNDKYFWMEILMLCCFTYFIAILSDVEYTIYESGKRHFISALEYRLAFGTFHFLLYGAYYWLCVKPLVLAKKPWWVFFSLILFVPVIHYYNHYVATNALIYLPLFSAELRNTAARQFKSEQNFGILYAYMLSSRCLPIIFFAYLVRSLKQEKLVNELKAQQLLAELNYLRAQVQPHFFFNTLNNIYALAIKQSPDTGPMVLKLSEMMRYILYQSGEKKVSLKQEIDFLSNYVEIEKIRHRNNVAILFDVQGDIAGVNIEPLLLLPFVENAFKHGARESLFQAEVSIVICVQDQELNLQVRNTKPDVSGKENEKGIGLENVRKRLALLYTGGHCLNIAESERQYEVNLTIELQ